jgi:hypothetical protein
MTTALLVATAILLFYLAVRDIRRTFSRIDEAHPRPVDPVDFAEEINAYRVARDIEDAGERRAVR